MADEKEKTEAKPRQSGAKRKKQVFPYGNYRSYYGYRLGQNFVEDPRLKVFKKEWFEGKDCLDIGCNNGIVTTQIGEAGKPPALVGCLKRVPRRKICSFQAQDKNPGSATEYHLARKFNCRSILGIDIDSDRVDDAYGNLRKASKLEAAESKNNLELHATSVSEANTEDSENLCSSKKRDLSTIVSFKQQNFIHSHPSKKQYDTILCLSVTKWIHLNWGDDGLITLFSNIWRLLHPGGILVLEPQPWKSYESNYRVSETTAKNFKSIKLRPGEFQEILLDKIGFRTVEDLTPELSSTNAGFNRPIFVFHK